MRIITALAGLTALTLAACGQGGDAEGGKEAARPAAAAAAAAQTGMTGPKPGLWRVTTEMAGLPSGMMPPVETCMQQQDFSEMQRGPNGPASNGVDCSEQTFRREGDAMVGHSVCTMTDGTRAESDIRVTGDFERRYTMEVRNRTTPAPSPSMATTTMTMTAERIGDCPTGSTAQ